MGQSGKDMGSGDKQPSFTSLRLGFLISEMGLWKDPQQFSGENTQRRDRDKGVQA